jgi:sugar/nucleoside kinase (ribokinase family)
MTARLLSVGNIVVDILATVPALPVRGGDVLASDSSIAPGGAFNVLLAAACQGLPSAYGGGHGTGFFGDLVRSTLIAAGIEAVQPVTTDSDSGYDVALIDAQGERTFVTVFGAEAQLTIDGLNAIVVQPDDLVHVSGYGLLAATNAAAIAPWVEALPAGNPVLLDPGPLVADIDPGIWAIARDRAEWLSCSEREATVLTGTADAHAAVDILARASRSVLVRLGADGCLLADGGTVEYIPGYPVVAVDTNGAGDAHCGAFLAGLAEGLSAPDAAAQANAAAAIATTRRGPATAPTLAEVATFLQSRRTTA